MKKTIFDNIGNVIRFFEPTKIESVTLPPLTRGRYSKSPPTIQLNINPLLTVKREPEIGSTL